MAFLQYIFESWQNSTQQPQWSSISHLGIQAVLVSNEKLHHFGPEEKIISFTKIQLFIRDQCCHQADDGSPLRFILGLCLLSLLNQHS